MTKLTPAQKKFLARFDEPRLAHCGPTEQGEVHVRRGETPTADKLEQLGLIKTTRIDDHLLRWVIKI